MQFHSPSGEQAPDAAPEVVVVPLEGGEETTGAGAAVGVLIGVTVGAASDAEDATSDVAAAEGDAMVTSVEGTGIIATGVDVGDWANAPPLMLALAAGADTDTDAPPPLLEPESPHPVSEPVSSVTVCLLTISGPGFGKMTSLPSTVEHPLPKFA
jgi:hypothetical protein